MNFKISLILKGMGMGIAEVIPGVSGGTIAFITGIYSQLINSIKAFDLELINMLMKFRFKEAAEKINIGFLTNLLLGMVSGLVIGIFVITNMLKHYSEVLWAIFFALILWSIPVMIHKVQKIDVVKILSFVLSVALAYVITELSPVEAGESWLYLFCGGVVAIVALVLPGISGSFILLLLGLYTLVIPTLKNLLVSPNLDDFLVIMVFGLGCITGLLFFSRLVSKAFDKYHDLTVMIMSGFMLGSLNKIWPWRNPELLLDKTAGITINLTDNSLDWTNLDVENYKILSENNVLPSMYHSDPHLIAVLVAFIITSLSMWLFFKYTKDV